MASNNHIKSKIIFYYMWLLVPLCPFILYLVTNLANISSTPAQYTVSVIFILYLFYCYKNKTIIPEPSDFDFSILALGFLCVYIAHGLSAYSAFYVSVDDFSTFMSLIENIDIGRVGFSQPVNMYHFGIHANWILFILYPFYKLFPYHSTFLVLGALAMWFPGVLLYVYAKKYLGLSKSESYIAVLVYFSNYYTFKILNGFFYPEFYFVSAFFLLLFARQSRGLIWLILATLFFCSIKEDFIYYILPWCVFNITFRKDKRFWLVVVIALGVFLVDNRIIQPYFLSKTGIVFQGYYHFWDSWGRNPHEIILNLLTHPIQDILFIIKSYGWKRLLGAFLFLPLLSMDMLFLFLPALLIYSLANYGTGLNTLQNYYSYIVWPAVLVGFLQIYKRITVSMLTAWVRPILLTVLVLNPLWGAGGIHLYRVNNQNNLDFTTMQSQMKPSETYCIAGALFSHFDTRVYQNIYRLNNMQEHEDCALVLSSQGDLYPFKLEQIQKLEQVLRQSGCIIAQQGDFYISSNSSQCYTLGVEILFENKAQ